MDADSVTIAGPMGAMLIGAVILVYGMAQGGLNPISMAGGFVVIAGVVWLALKIDRLDPEAHE